MCWISVRSMFVHQGEKKLKFHTLDHDNEVHFFKVTNSLTSLLVYQSQLTVPAWNKKVASSPF